MPHYTWYLVPLTWSADKRLLLFQYFEYFIALNLIQFLAKLQYKQNLNHVMRIQNIYKSITVKEHLHDTKSKIKIIRYIQSEIEKEKEKKTFGNP